MGAALVSVNVHVHGDAPVAARQATDGGLVWLEVGEGAGSLALFFDRAGLERVRSALGEVNERMPASEQLAAA
jgi:hypothetical protein